MGSERTLPYVAASGCFYDFRVDANGPLLPSKKRMEAAPQHLKAAVRRTPRIILLPSIIAIRLERDVSNLQNIVRISSSAPKTHKEAAQVFIESADDRQTNTFVLKLDFSIEHWISHYGPKCVCAAYTIDGRKSSAKHC